MKILFIGDIAWRPGRQIVTELLLDLRKELAVDLVIANGENARHGSGMSLKIYDALRVAGVDWFTSGDHIWKHDAFLEHLNQPGIQVLRPLNALQEDGRGTVEISVGDELVTLINMQGEILRSDSFGYHGVDNPFRAIDEVLEYARGFTLIDFHAETTSEKNTMGHYVDGRAGALIGTHTHVQTADERLLPHGTAYITDAGMTGPRDGSIGVAIESVLPNFLGEEPVPFEPATGSVQLNAVLLTFSGTKATSIKRIQRFSEHNA